MVQVISRAMEIVRLISESDTGLRLFEIAEIMNLKRTTVFNIIGTLVGEGMLEKKKGARYILGPAISQLYLKQNKGMNQQIREKAMMQLKSKYNVASVAYTELVGSDILITSHISYQPGSNVQYPQFAQINPYLTVAGLIFFAYMNDDMLSELKAKYPFEYRGREWWETKERLNASIKRTLKTGYSESEMTPPDILKYAVPIFHSGDCLSGAITITFEDKDEWDDISSQIIKDLLDTAAICSQ